MRRIALALALVALHFSAGIALAQQDVKERSDAARAAALDIGATLVGELQKGLAAGGPINAIGVCNFEAPKIAVAKATEKKMTIARTSLKLRQANNKPDAWELAQLQSFEQRKAAGENPMTIEFGEYTDMGGKRVFRFMKAIATGEVCLNCHGSDVRPEVLAKIKELYPQDVATGFKMGDLRGAFTIVQTP